VQANGRISPEDSGLWLDAHIAAMVPTVQFAHSQGQKIGIQIGHAGRKASTVAPWLTLGSSGAKRAGATATHAVGGWPDDVVSASEGAYNEHYPSPRALTIAEIDALKADFVAAAKRAVVAGFDVVELHAAHGYLFHQFLSPATNKRTDRYGGSFENRTRLLLEVTESVREVLPKDMPLFVRLSATDWLEHDEYDGESWTLNQSIELAKLLADKGVDFLDVSSGGLHPLAKIKGGPGYQVPFAKAIKQAVGDRLIVSAVGTIEGGKQAQDIVQGGKDADDTPIDVVMVGRLFQKNPGLVWSWAEELGIAIHVANQMGWPFGGYGGKGRH
jgi:2,4-dienoyl-CoA reductase-like NADH-dependent reductase (Old Yellow Enzyme family)